ncbi:MAG: amino acid adenylation domain-containing protein, partial [Candidatus Methanosuratincola sp.]
PLEVDNETAKLDLIFFVWEGSQRLTCTVEYNTDLFDEATIERMFCNFETLLEGIAGDPAMPISRLPLISPSELRKVLVDWNATERDYPRTACVHELIEAQARRTPDHISLIAGGESLTYRELNSRANKLARYLRNLGVEPDQLVGICMEPSADMAVSLLGILKAGGAYFPLDPSYPKERLSFMMDDAAVRVVVTQRRLVGELPRSDARVVCIDSDWQKISNLSGDDLEPRATSENLAYVIYTSGSTGKPKGVMIAHRSVVNHNLAMMSSFELSPQDRVLQYHSINFDAAVETIFPTWMSGATVVFRTQKVTAPGADLRRLIENGRTTVLSFSSAYWNEWVHELAASGGVLPDYVRLVVIGGDRASPESVEVWLRLFGNRIRLLNTYGPTEATVTATQYDITGASQWVRREIPIGKPISNTSVYILDRNLEPVPIGVPGELFIGGDGVARGYLNREDVTAERFIRDPFSTKPGARMYRTGDLARFLPDGNIEFLGRLDNQVKIRGYRIEPGEVEAAVLWHDAVRDCVVVPRDDDFGQKRLVAYVVPYDGRHVGVSELRSFLAERLPEYMVPSYFVLLDALPLTPNGKVDRKALPTPTYDRQETKESYVPPRDDVERELVRIWEEIFGIHPIGVKDNFFQLGGHSFLALRLMAQINRVFGVNIPLVALFQGGTIEHLALAVLHRNAFSESSPLVKIQPQGAKPPFFCVHPIGGSVLCYANLARSLGQDRPFYGIESPGIHGRLEPMGSIEDMAACYIEAMREVQPRGPYLIGGHSFGGIVAFEMAQQLRARGEEVSLLVLLDSWPRMRTEGVAKEEIEFLIDTVSVDVGIPKDVILKAWEGTTGLGFAALMESQSDMVTNLARFIAPETEFEHIKRYIDVFYANLAAMRSYSPREYEGKIALIRAEEQLPGEDPTMGWGELVEEVEVSVAPGNHVTMLREPNVHQLALKLKSLLDACGGG